jgi:hypothetical protein
MSIFDGEYKFLEAGRFDRTYGSVPEALLNAEYKDLAESFKATFDRLLSLFELPLQLIYWSGKIAQIKFIARYRIGIDPEDTSKDQSLAFQETFQTVLNEVTSTGGMALRAAEGPLSGMVGDGLDGGGVPQAREGVEAVLAAMVMASYAAFETLAADVWIVAVNRDYSLAKNWIDKNSERQLPTSVLAGYDFNVSARMGTILHDTKRVSFESLNEIKNLYSQTFKGGVDGAFEPFDDLAKAEKTRHLFAHRGGLIDQKFKAQMAKYPEYANAVIGERLRLTGPVTGEHVNACAQCGVALLRQVDNWGLGK